MSNKRGILILAMGSQKYFHMASNLCASIKANSDLPVALLCDSRGGINPKDVKGYDHIIQMKAQHSEARNAFYVKTLLYQYSPFKETLFIDADSLCISDPEAIFDKFTEDFNAVVNMARDYPATGIGMIWGKPKEIMDHYGFEDRVFHELQNSAILFRKTQKAKDIFTLAEHYFACDFYPHFKGLGPEKMQAKGLGWYPDELAFEIALLAVDADLDGRFSPIHFDYGVSVKGSKYFSVNAAKKTHQFFSLPGGIGNNHSSRWEVYNNSVGPISRKAAEKVTGSFVGCFNSGAGYRVKEQDKAANHVPLRRWEGLRKRQVSKKISNLIEKYNGEEETE